MGKFCGVAYWDPIQNTRVELVKDSCGSLTNNTYSFNFPANTSFYIDLQYDCEKWGSDCSVRFTVRNQTTGSVTQWTQTIGWVGAGIWTGWQILPALPTAGTTYTIKVEAHEDNQLQDSFTLSVTAIQLGYVEVYSVTASKYTVVPNETFTVTAYLRNPGQTPATRTISLTVNNTVRETRNVSLSPGQTKTETFNLSISSTGTHSVCVD